MASDESLHEAIRGQLDGARRTARQGRRRARWDGTERIEELNERRRKLLELHYHGQISADLFGSEESMLAHPIETLRGEADHDERASIEHHEIAQRFEQVLQVLAELDLKRVWTVADDKERRVLIDELLDRITVYPDHLEVIVHGVPKINVLLSEVGLAESQNARVGGGTRTLTPRAPAAGQFAIAA